MTEPTPIDRPQPAAGRSPRELLEELQRWYLEHSSATAAEVILSRSINERRGIVPTLRVEFSADDVWYIEMERESR